jgi:hypothetical protein
VQFADEFMLELFRSLSWGGGALIIVMVSVIATCGFAHIKNRSTKGCLIVLSPFVFSYGLYWAPVWLGADPSEYYSWSLLFIIPWGFAGLSASLISMKIIRALEKNRTR